MDILFRIVDLAVRYHFVVFIAVFALLSLNFAVNAFSNVYRKTNKQLQKARRSLQICAAQNGLARIGSKMPADYRNQWHCFVFSLNAKPGEVMNFERRKQAVFGIWLYALLILVNVFYIICLAFGRADYSVVPYVAAFAAIFVLSAVLIGVLKKFKERKSKRLFNSFLAVLDFCLPDGVRTEEIIGQKAATKQAVENAVGELNTLKNDESGENAQTLGKVTEILRQKGLNGERTSDQQRKINFALNSLLQSMCKKERANSEKAAGF